MTKSCNDETPAHEIPGWYRLKCCAERRTATS
jgi:hypothetical protein